MESVSSLTPEEVHGRCALLHGRRDLCPGVDGNPTEVLDIRPFIILGGCRRHVSNGQRRLRLHAVGESLLLVVLHRWIRDTRVTEVEYHEGKAMWTAVKQASVRAWVFI